MSMQFILCSDSMSTEKLKVTSHTACTMVIIVVFIINIVCVQVFTPLMQFTASAVFSYMHCSCVCRTNTDDTEVRMYMCVCVCAY